jgi:hypothetical protein
MRLENKLCNKLVRDQITKLSIDITLGIFFSAQGLDVQISFDDSKMKNIKIIGIDKLVH